MKTEAQGASKRIRVELAHQSKVWGHQYKVGLTICILKLTKLGLEPRFFSLHSQGFKPLSLYLKVKAFLLAPSSLVPYWPEPYFAN